jgi:imidazolonepropionase-like amidohydrolase
MSGSGKAEGGTKERVTYVRGGALIDGNGGPVVKNPVIVVEGKRIKRVGTADTIKVPKGAAVIDAGKCTLMPGLIDGHVHIAAYNTVSFHNYRVAMFEVSSQLQEFYTLFHAQLCFEMGFTTLRDMGRNNARANFAPELCAVRDAINAGIMPGPRLYVSGRIMTTGSHHDMNLPRAAYRHPGYTVDGPWEVRRAAREHIRTGVDIVKVCVTGGASADEDGDTRNMTQEELNAAVDEAHGFHKPVAAHCWTALSHRMCVEAGIDTIEHMVYTDEASTRMVAEAGIPVSPTLLHRTDHAIEVRKRCGSPANVLKKMKEVQPYCYESFKRMHQAGVKIFMGTDIQYDPEMGSNAAELELYVQLGMTPMEAIQTATKNAAEAMRIDKDIGTLEAGKFADIIAVNGNPASDIKVLQDKANIRLVMKEGRAYVDKLSAQPRYVLHPEPGQWKIVDNL